MRTCLRSLVEFAKKHPEVWNGGAIPPDFA